MKILVGLLIFIGLLVVAFFILKINPKPKIISLKRRVISEEDIDKMARDAVGQMTTEEKVQMMSPRLKGFLKFGLEMLGDGFKYNQHSYQAGGNERSGLLCDTFEAVIGALFLDKGINGVITFISPILETAAEDILVNHKDEDPKSKLQEWAQGNGFQAPQYTTRNSFGPDHSKLFEVDVYINGEINGSGMGQSKHAATKKAALDALKKLGIADDIFGSRENS